MRAQYVVVEIMASDRTRVSTAGRTSEVPLIEDTADSTTDLTAGGVWSRCTSEKKNSAMETLFVECVEGNPYSK